MKILEEIIFFPKSDMTKAMHFTGHKWAQSLYRDTLQKVMPEEVDDSLWWNMWNNQSRPCHRGTTYLAWITVRGEEKNQRQILYLF